MDDQPNQPLVLIADDDDLTRSLMSAALAEHDFETIEVGNGKEAVKLIPRLNPDLVILDVQMPEMDGFSACAAIRASDYRASLPIVIVTGSDDTVSVERAFDVGATDFISKPVNWSLLGHRMRYVLRGAQTRDTLARREAENSALLDAFPDRLALSDRAGNILNYISRHEEEIEHYSHGRLEDLLPPDHVPTMLSTISQVLATNAGQTVEISGNLGFSRQQERSFYEVRVNPQSTDTVLLTLRDVTTKKQTDERIHQLAFFDSLTSLPNRHSFLHRTHDQLDGAEQTQHALYLFNLDHFRRINDTLGEAAGDKVLVELARRLESLCSERSRQRHSAFCARLGGNEFALLTTVADENDLRATAEHLKACFEKPIDGGQHDLFVTSTIGVALFPEDADAATELQSCAAHAMQISKQAGGNILTYYRDCPQSNSAEFLELGMQLRRAIDNNELQLFLQPKYDLNHNTLAGAEALLRWFHPERGMVPPNLFIPMAEQSGLIIDIDRWVTDNACALLRDWEAAGLPLVPISINISGRAFLYDKPATTIAKALAAHSVDPKYLEVEITETVLMGDAQTAIDTLHRLNDMGVRLAIDDFGTGYSSLSYLKRFPLHTLKVDRAFVKDLDEDENDRALCRAMVTMAHSLGLTVVAEGIETEFQRSYLRSIGCELAQGFLLDKPMPVDAFAEKLQNLATIPPAETIPAGTRPATRH